MSVLQHPGRNANARRGNTEGNVDSLALNVSFFLGIPGVNSTG